MTRKPILIPFQDEHHSHADCLQSALVAAETLCQQRGVRLTPLRRRVLELVWQSHEPVKAYDMLEKLHQEQRRAAPPTVYRALEFLQAHGFVHRIESLNAFVGCGAPQESHDGQFLICRGCGEVAEIDDKDITQLLSRKALGLGFHIDNGTIEIKGLCAGCRNSV